ncbi:MAG: HlyD family efflux transporter periplasmic adaptor subunit, partial [Alphaproteobacteria bacterium]
PLDAYRVVLRVDESQVGDVRPGQRGRLLVVSLPDRPLDFVVERVTPVAVAEEGRNAFEVEARVEGDAARLRPGMEGVGKVEVESRRLVWIWARPLIDWARLALWRWTG